MNFFKSIYSTIFFVLVGSAALAQGISGKVVDETGLAIEAVLVQNLHTDQHTHTNQQGTFLLNGIEAGDTLTLTHAAYNTISVVVKEEKERTIILELKTFELDQITVSPEVNALNVVSKIDLKTTPVNSSQEVLRKVPGLIIGQHAGGGKAEQIFLRGFDIDHGTDIAISVDGMPVNMVSHAHGQGYADLHFVIPETIEKIDFGKGTYYADQGNFSTAGYVAFQTKDRLENNIIQTEIGQYNTKRLFSLINLSRNSHHAAYVASEYLTTDGYFESPQNFSRLNVMGKYTGELDNNNKLSVSASHFQSSWDASGQIPERAVETNIISRFGAIDDTEGGNTSRSNLNLNYIHQLSKNSSLTSRFYLSHYDFELYSNFTFYLEDAEHGDQIRQKEDRNMFGFNSEWNRFIALPNGSINLSAGVGLRDDQTTGTALSHSLNRQTTLETLKLGDIHETNSYAYAQAELVRGKWTVNPALRLDYFQFGYYDRLSETYENNQVEKGILSPKLNVLYQHSPLLQYYLKTGIGFHSNDTRVVVAEEGESILPKAYSSDLGLIWKAHPRLLVNAAVWNLFLEQEFVYVGDAGIVEPSGKTNRSGFDLGVRWQLLDWLYFSQDVNYAYARSVSDPEGENYIPLAPDLTAVGTLSISGQSNWYGSIQYRYISDRPANEDNTIVAEGYTVVDTNLGYQFKHFDLGLKIQNLFDVEWKETQFATESRLFNETSSVEEIHYTPGIPFCATAMLRYKF
ncbi:TonB-dependent receptor plug domain-containing protein [Limibacter armeniacum]|uniref:TonB-dependent receptor n=1 Tax=Limibacter armeniacum TaxID=466084 RepID=UPI002FE67917